MSNWGDYFKKEEEESDCKPRKNKQYFLRQAIVKTVVTGLLYLLMPVWADFYNSFIPQGYEIYQLIGAAILLIGNIILLAQGWALALDKDVRADYHKDN